MRHLLAAASAIALVIAPCTLAQDTSPEASQAAITAYQAGNATEALRLAELAIALASHPGELYGAQSLYADLLRVTGDHARAYELYTRALETLEENFADETEAMTRTLRHLGETALALGRRDEWLALGDRLLELERADLSVLWIFDEADTAHHRLSGYNCPASTAGLVRTDFTTFQSTGRDVACVYTFPDTRDIAVTVHITHQPGYSLDQAFYGGHEPVRRNRPNASQIARNQQTTGGVTVEHALYREQALTTGIWSAQVGDWTLKLRLTDYLSQLSPEQMQAAAELTFAPATSVAAHQERCNSLTGSGALDFNLPDGHRLEAIALAVLNAPGGQRSDLRMDCYLGEPDFQPTGGIAYAEIEEDGSITALTAHPAGSREALVQVVRGSTAMNSNLPLLVYQPRGSELYGAYADFPTGEVFLADIDRILAGEIPLQSSVTRDEEGNAAINLIPRESTED